MLDIIMVLIIVIGFKVRTEHVIRILCRGDKHFAVVGMKSQLLDVVLSLMQEHKLWGNVFFVILHLLVLIDLDREVPDSQFVVGGCDSQYGVFTWLELQRGDSRGVPPDTRDRLIVRLIK